jgi:phospholipid-binding lipoprotein MlaA
MGASLLSRWIRFAAISAPLALGACATAPPASDTAATQEFEQTNDPLEPTNRVLYNVSDAIDRYTLKPVAQAYVFVFPTPVRTGLHNVLANLSSPVVLANDVAQAKSRRAGDTFMRFLINSSVGVLGVFDVASGWGYKPHDNDFGITLALWGVPDGPYLFLPLLGPSNPRDAVGFGGDIALDPFTYVPRGYGLLTLNWARYGLGIIDARAAVLDDLDKIKASALDPYATIRSLARQHRDAAIAAARGDTRSTPPDWSAQ